MSARRTGTTAVNKRGVRHPRQSSSVPPPSGVVTLASAQLADNPLALWLMQETSGSVMNDSSGNARHGTYTGGTLAQSPIGSNGTYAVSLGGTDYATVTYGSWMNVDYPTFEVLIYPTAVSGTRGIAVRGGPDAWQLRYSGATASHYFDTTGSDGANITTGTISADTAYLIAFKLSGGNVTVWQNGVNVGTLAMIGTMITGAWDIRIGRSATAYLTGKISHVAYYGTALSDARLLAHAQAAGLA